MSLERPWLVAIVIILIGLWLGKPNMTSVYDEIGDDAYVPADGAWLNSYETRNDFYNN